MVCPVTSPRAGLIDQVVAKSVDHEILTLSPVLMVLRSEVKEVMRGAGFTVTVTSCVTGPSSFVAVRMKSVVEAGETMN